jgi:hypothetical protein
MRVRLLLSMVIVSFLFVEHAFAGPTVVACAPGQHAVVRDAFVGGERVTSVRCATGSSYRTAAYRTRYASESRVTRRNRSWGKSALVIGGSAATGAGIGGIIHGRKGALIGAALGGGAGSLYEGARRR